MLNREKRLPGSVEKHPEKNLSSDLSLLKMAEPPNALSELPI